MKLKENKKVYFDEITHSYYIKDKRLKGVTTLLHEKGLAPDYGFVKEEVLQYAADRGSAIHKTLEDYDNGELVMQPIKVGNNEFNTSAELVAYQGLFLKVAASEYLVSDNVNIASKIDKVLEGSRVNRAVLADIKTTSSVDKVYCSWQLSIYAYLFELQNPTIQVEGLKVIHIREGKAKEIEVERVSDDRVINLIESDKAGDLFVDEGKESLIGELMGAESVGELERIEGEIIKLESVLKMLKGEVEERREKIYNYMLGKHMTSLPLNREFEYTLRQPTIREGLDTAKVKKECPEIYAKYLKRSEVKGSVTLKARKLD